MLHLIKKLKGHKASSECCHIKIVETKKDNENCFNTSQEKNVVQIKITAPTIMVGL